MSTPEPTITVVFVNFHSEQLLVPRCEQLLASSFDVVVVDNSGTFDGAGRVIRPGANVGFGAACNAAFATLPGSTDVVILHNPDVDATVEALDELALRLRGQPCPGLVAPAVWVGGVLRHRGYRMPTLPREMVLGIVGSGRPRVLGGGRTPAPSMGTEGRFGSAALLAAHVDALTTVGGFDERYFLYLEDCDLWHRICAAGHTVDFASDLVVQHGGAAGSPMDRCDRSVLRSVGVELFVAVHRRAAWRAFRAAHLPAMLIERRRGSALAAFVVSCWRRSWPPEEVASAIKERLGSKVS